MEAKVPNPDRIIYSVSPGERRIALLSGARPVEFYIDRVRSYSAGTICRGRITAKAPGGKAFFVDIGNGVTGFLPAYRSGYTEGESVLVGVAKEAHGYKNIKLTDNLTLAGLYLVYTTGKEPVVFSKRLADNERKQNIWSLLTPLLTRKDSVIVRAGAEHADDKILLEELESLKSRMQNITEEFQKSKTPEILQEAYDFLPEMLISYGDKLREIVCDDAGEAKKISNFFKSVKLASQPEVTVYKDKEDLFAAYGLDEAIDEALNPIVVLPEGIRIIIEPTEAFWAIDVDSAGCGASFEEINKKAALEIMRQIRLRNLSGQIIVDFISNKEHKLSSYMIGALREGLAQDSLPAFFAGVSPLGHAEIIRERRTQSLLEVLCRPSECKGFEPRPETLALAVLREALRRGRSGKSTITVKVPPEVLDLLATRLADFTSEVNQKLGGSLDIIADTTLKDMLTFVD